MNEKMFDELLDSVREAGKIRRLEKAPSRIFAFTPEDIKAIRESLSLSQSKFAHLIFVSIKTLQNWEQGRRRPRGPALALLKILQRNPRSAIQALHG